MCIRDRLITAVRLGECGRIDAAGYAGHCAGSCGVGDCHGLGIQAHCMLAAFLNARSGKYVVEVGEQYVAPGLVTARSGQFSACLLYTSRCV